MATNYLTPRTQRQNQDFTNEFGVPLSMATPVQRDQFLRMQNQAAKTNQPYIPTPIKRNPVQYIPPAGQMNPGIQERAKLTSAPQMAPRAQAPSTPLTGKLANAPSHVRAFVQQYLPIAEKIEKEFGISKWMTLAQAGLESGWGKSGFAQGRNNFFGLAAYDSNPDMAWSFPTAEDSFRAYGRLLSSDPRYSRAYESRLNPEMMVREIKRAGYASDPDYVNKVLGIMNTIGGA